MSAACPSIQRASRGCWELAAKSAGIEIKAHPHMLRHAGGYKLANSGRDTRAI
jgi:site-specific recombinase XerD